MQGALAIGDALRAAYTLTQIEAHTARCGAARPRWREAKFYWRILPFRTPSCTSIDVDSNQRTAMDYNVRSIPSVLFFKDGLHVDTVVGAVPKAYLVEKIEEHLN